MNVRVAFPVVLLGALFLAGCVSPMPLAEAVQVLRDGPLRSIETGRTTRQEVLLRLGTSSSSFEADRILTYDFCLDPVKREWHQVGGAGGSDWMYPGPRTASLVLVFGADGVLVRQNLVLHEALPVPAPKPSSAEPGS